MDHTARDDPSKENMMKRFLIAVAAAVFAIGAMLTPSAPAQAGFKGRFAIGLAIGAIALSQRHHAHRHWQKKRYYARRKAEKKVYASKKSSSPTKKIAKAEPEPKVETVNEPVENALIENENSSISVAALAPVKETASIDGAEAAEPVAETSEAKPENGQKSASKLDCKKFFPAVGMTLSVSCE
jgi:hypothetical protein